MLSLPPTWNYTIEGLSRLAKDGRDSIKTALKELENFGYLERKQIRNDNGSFCDLEYFVYEKPQPKEPLAENPSTDKSSTENPSQLNTYKSNKDKLNTKDKDNILSGERSVWECVINLTQTFLSEYSDEYKWKSPNKEFRNPPMGKFQLPNEFISITENTKEINYKDYIQILFLAKALCESASSMRNVPTNHQGNLP